MSEKLREHNTPQDGQDAKSVPGTRENPETNTIPEEQLEDISGGAGAPPLDIKPRIYI